MPERFRPNILLADSARAITRCFEVAFDYESENDYTRLNCWSHVGLNIYKYI